MNHDKTKLLSHSIPSISTSLSVSSLFRITSLTELKDESWEGNFSILFSSSTDQDRFCLVSVATA